MPRLLVAGKMHPSGEALLKELQSNDVTVDYTHEVSEASIIPLIPQADAMVIRTQPLTAPTIALAERLKVVSRHGVGYDSVDLAALNAHGIALTVVGDVNSVSVAEHAMMQLLAASKRAIPGDRAVRNPSEWNWRNRLEPREISGRNLLIIGYGRIGRHLARMASGFGMQIRAYDPYLLANGWPDGPVTPAPDLHEALGWADYISVHIPRSEAPLLAAAEFAAMKQGAVLSNTARGGIVCETALIDALRSGKVGAAGIDVFDDEPPRDPSPFAEFDNVVLSPHVAGLTFECSERMALGAIENAMNYLNGTIDPSLIINKSNVMA